MILIKLFWSFFQIGLFSFGGGYAALPLIQHQIVDLHGWLDLKEFADVITISQMTPGPIAINAATFVGIQVSGLAGAVIATLGCVLPSLIIVLVLAIIYQKYKSLLFMRALLSGLKPAVVALIATAGLSILILTIWKGHTPSWDIGSIDWISLMIFILSFVFLRVKKSDPILVMLLAGLGGLVAFGLF